MTLVNLYKLQYLLNILFFWCLVLVGVYPYLSATGQSIPFQNYRLEDGLIDEKCYDILQDDIGYLWLGTNSGLVRYDGVEFKSYPIPNIIYKEVYRLKLLNNTLFFLTAKQGLFIYENDSVYQPKALKELHELMTSKNWNIHSIAKNDSNGLSIGVNSYDSLFHQILVDKEFHFDIKTELPNRGEHTRVQFFNSGDRIVSGHHNLIYNEYIRVIFPDSNFRIPFIRKSMTAFSFRLNDARRNKRNEIAISYGNTLAIYSKSGIQNYSFEKNLNPGAAWFENDSTIWIGIRNSYATCISINNSFQNTRAEVEEQPLFNITRFIRVRNGGIFAVSNSNGLYHAPNPFLNQIDPYLNFKDLTKVNGQLVFLTHSGHVIKARKQGYDTLWTDPRMQQVLSTNNRLVVMSIIDSLKWVSDSFMITRWFGSSIVTSSDSNLLVLNSKLHRKFSRTDWTKFNHSIYYDQVAPINTMAFFGLKSGTLYFQNTDKEKIEPEPIPWTCQIHSLLKSTNGKVFIADISGQLWDITNLKSPIKVFQDSLILTKKILKIENLNNEYFLLFKDLVVHLDLHKSNKKATFLYLYSKLFDGPFKSFEVVNNRVYILDNRQVYSTPYPFSSTNKTYPPVLTALYNDLRSEKISDLNYQKNSIEILNSGFNFSKNPHLIQQFTIKHGQNTAKYNLTGNRIFLPDLASGDHIISAHTLNNVTLEKTVSSSITVSITKPIWETWWFYPLVLGLFLTPIGVSLGFYYRSKLKTEMLYSKLNLLRSKAITSQLKPHFSFNALGSIQFLMKTNKIDEADTYLTKFAKLLRLVLEHMNEDWYSFNMEKEILEHYVSLENLRFRKTTEILFENNSGLDFNEFCVPPMFLQILIENSIHHGFSNEGHTGKILIQITKHKSGQLKISVLDNGVGFSSVTKKPNKLHSGDSKGLKMIEERLELISKSENSRCRISYGSSNLLGAYKTYVRIVIPIKQC